MFDFFAIILYLPCFVDSLLVPLSLSFVPIAYVVGVKKGAVQGEGERVEGKRESTQMTYHRRSCFLLIGLVSYCDHIMGGSS